MKFERTEVRKEQQKKLHEVWEGLGDWWAICKRCGERLRGTPKALREHRCVEKR